MLRRKLLVFSLVCLVAAVIAGGYVSYAVLRTRQQASAASSVPVGSRRDLDRVLAGPRIIVRNTALGPDYGKVAVVPLSNPQGPRYTVDLSCERLAYASGHGLCLSADRGVLTSYALQVFDERFAERGRVPLRGAPSRARVSPDGRYAAATIFVSGDSYLAAGFSTRTYVIDAATAELKIELEELTIWKDGARFRLRDFNFWGVTFRRDGNVFYATLSTGGTIYLVDGDVARREGRIIARDVECPALSPDNTRVAFKKRLPRGQAGWRLHVRDLASGVETPLAEARSVDDQAEWLDDRSIIYALPDQTGSSSAGANVWVVPADGSGSPSLLVRQAESPAVVR